MTVRFGANMAFQSSAGMAGAGAARAFGGNRESRAEASAGNQERDLKTIVLIVGLGALSWVATYVGMLELIEANMGELPLIHKGIIGFSVAMLMTMIIWLLDQMFAPIPFSRKVLYAAGYVFLSLISVGFGFGFYWKVLESRSEASRSAEAAVGQVQGSLNAAATRLEQVQGTLVKLSQISSEKAEIERTKGTSCPNSRPGDGPRRKLREDDAARFSFASDFVKDRATSVKTELSALDGDLMKIVNADASTFDPKTGTRNEFMKALSRKLDLTVTSFNAFRTDPQLRQIRTELADRADQSTFGDPKKGGFICPDAQLQGALRGAVKAIDQLPELEKPKIAAVEGSEATIEAFRRLTATIYGALSFKMPPSADELRELQQKAVQSVETTARPAGIDDNAVGLSKRDWVPLSVAAFVDLCLLLVSMGRPADRLGGLLPRMQAAERSPVSTILSRFNDIHRDADVRQTFEVFRHVVFDQGGVYYVAVPLDVTPSVTRRMAYEDSAVSDLHHEAHLLANLFTSFEKERIFARVHSPLLTTAAVQKKLARQGSKFAACRAFRIYRFRDGAWQEIILGAVMGAAKRVEEQRAADARHTMSVPFQPPTVPASGQRKKIEATGPARGLATGEVDARFTADHGPYAKAARDELSVRPERDAPISVRAANSNTAPAVTVQPFSTSSAVAEDASPVVVPLPVRPRPANVPDPAPTFDSELSPFGTASASGLDRPPGEARETIDVLVSRETARFRVPVSQATLPMTIFSGPSDSNPPQSRVAEGERGLLAISDHGTDEDWTGEDTLIPAGDGLFADDDPDSLARIASRLRPARPLA
ncbi:MAG: hypothetical protein MUC37_02500 [Hyphomicrobium sp.]|nr:hypothetical protein [Hyphomicrobium sp.]